MGWGRGEVWDRGKKRAGPGNGACRIRMEGNRCCKKLMFGLSAGDRAGSPCRHSVCALELAVAMESTNGVGGVE